jgi:hypothetical protein
MASETQRKGDWQQTFTGRQFWPLDPRIEDIDIEDIAHALSLQCRFAGHCRTFYSVAEHSVRVSLLIEAWNVREGYSGAWRYTSCLAALLHDASEAYCIDVPRPLKPYLTGYKAIEADVMSAVERWAGLNPGACSVPAIKHADEVLLATEARDLMKITHPWHLKAEPLPDVILPWWSHTAESRFIARFNELKGHG